MTPVLVSFLSSLSSRPSQYDLLSPLSSLPYTTIQFLLHSPLVAPAMKSPKRLRTGLQDNLPDNLQGQSDRRVTQTS